MILGRAVPDQDLVRLVLQGRTERFADLVKRYRGLVASTILARVPRGDEVEDLAQETFYRAFRYLEALDDPSCFGPWLRRIADHVAVNYLRSRGVRTQLSADLLPLPSATGLADQTSGWRQVHDRVWAAIEELPLPLRQVVLLYYMEDRSCAEISQFLGATVGAVKGRLHRARLQLGAALSDLDRTTGRASWHERWRRGGLP